MAQGPFVLYDNALKEMIDSGNIQIGSHTFEARLFSSSSNVETTSHDDYTDLTNELASSNGYAAATSAGSVTVDSGVTQINFTKFTFSPTANGFSARYLVISRQGVDDPLVGYCLLDSTPADFTFEPGRTYEFTSVGGAIQLGACP